MTEHVHLSVAGGTGFITLDRPQALNSLSLDMVRAITAALLAWRDDDSVAAVVLRSTSAKALSAGGDIRFFHTVAGRTPREGSAQLDDFFTEEYSLDHLVHTYPKPYVALMDGVTMGGGMGISQAGPQSAVRIVTNRTKIAMPEVNIGLFPDVGGSYFLPRTPGHVGLYLALTALPIGAADALYAGFADHYVPADRLPALSDLIESTGGAELREAIAAFAAPLRDGAGAAELQQHQALIDRHFGQGSVADIAASLRADDGPFAHHALAALEQRSPLLLCVTFEMLRRGATLGIADCLRMERNLVRRTFEHGDVVEGIRALVIDKDNAPRWEPSRLGDVTEAQVARFFEPAWPPHAHPLRSLR